MLEIFAAQATETITKRSTVCNHGGTGEREAIVNRLLLSMQQTVTQDRPWTW